MTNTRSPVPAVYSHDLAINDASRIFLSLLSSLFFSPLLLAAERAIRDRAHAASWPLASSNLVYAAPAAGESVQNAAPPASRAATSTIEYYDDNEI